MKEPLTIEEAQHLADKWIHEIGGGYFSELTNMVLLTEETGELARIIARVYGEQKGKEGDMRKSLAEELADVMWVLICLANQTGVDLTDAFIASLKKKYTRDRYRFLGKDSLTQDS
ncbi:MAG: nucleotide pyrophosphohydrolase [Muribaculaceae bacterium]|nr:nucleotide pyrophosphohydrolase [Muribaculaceae bacterium]